MLKGYHKLGTHVDSRLPINLPILHRLLESTSQLAISRYQVCQSKAMCSTAFYALLRVGEMTSSSPTGSHAPLQLSQLVQLFHASHRVIALKINFADFKHGYNQRPFFIIIPRQVSFCPVQLLLDYLRLRGDHPGPLFANSDNSPLSRASFSDTLCIPLKSCGLSPTRYKGHSFRIGAASFAANGGMSDAQIRALGRWKSSAFLKYIRLPSLSAS